MNVIGTHQNYRILIVGLGSAPGKAHTSTPAEDNVKWREFAALAGATVHSGEGRYKGQKEDALLIFLPVEDEGEADQLTEEALALGKELGQESLLVVHEHTRGASLVACDGGEETALGKFRRVSKFEADKADGATLDIFNNQWYVAG